MPPNFERKERPVRRPIDRRTAKSAAAAPHQPSGGWDFEPWRNFRSSAAIQFTSSKWGGWSNSRLDAGTRSEIVAVLEALHAARQAYVNFRYGMLDLVLDTVRPIRNAGVVTDLRARLDPQPSLADPLKTIALPEKQLSLILESCVEVHESLLGKISFRLRLDRQRCEFGPARLRSMSLQVCEALANSARATLNCQTS